MWFIISCRTSGYGNCLFNACSIALVGDESLAVSLRCLTAIELYQNAQYYALHPLLELQHNNGAFNSTNNAFAMSISDAALDASEGKNHVQAVCFEASRIAKDYQSATFVCELALASVIGRPIEAYYPVRKDGDDLERETCQRNGLEIMFNSTILPREECLIGQSKLHILRCASVPLDYLKTGTVPDTKDHFVPLMPPFLANDVTSGTVCHISSEQTQLIPDFSKSNQQLAFFSPRSSSQPVDLKSVQTVALKPRPSSSKHRQATIDSFTQFKKPRNADAIPGPCVVSSQDSSSSKGPLPMAQTTEHIHLVDTPLQPLAADNQLDSEVENAGASDSFQITSSKESLVAAPSLPFHNNDIGRFYNTVSTLSDSQKYELLCHVWKPKFNHNFPSNSRSRRFQFKWFTIFPWLAYSQLLDGAFCINCVLFGGESSHNASKLHHLFRSPLDCWSKAVDKLKDHALKSPIHATATIRASQFRRCMENEVESIDIQLNNKVSEQVRQNRDNLKSIVAAIVFCGRQNIALRGHRDDSASLQNDANNPGNLQALLGFLSEHGNNVSFRGFLASAPRNASYRSKTTQNELVLICGNSIRDTLVKEIKEAKFFAVLADEAADISNIEQMALVLRFVDRACNIREEFLGFIHCSEGLSGEAISETILAAVKDSGLEIELCRGQGYDGAGNMAGKCSGAAVRIQRAYPKAMYVHCGSHILNLCVASACSIPVVRNMMGQVRVVSAFFNVHPKRSAVLKDKIKSLLPEAAHSRLIDVCRTRWIARIDGMEIFIELFPAIVSALEAVKDNADGSWNGDSIRDASALYHATISFGFLVSLVVVCHCLQITRPLTKQLQSPQMDVVKCLEKVNLLFSMLKRYREEIDHRHKFWYEEAVSLAETVGTVPSKPRIASVQQNRSNTPSDTVSEYYRRILSIPFMDHLITQISARFCDRNVAALDGFFGLPSEVVCYKDWRPKFRRYLSLYESDLPEPHYIECELDMWEETWERSKAVPPANVRSLLPMIDKITFPNIFAAFQILGTLPVTSCSCERSISVLRRLKTYLRNTMKEDRLNALALLHVHRDIPIDIEEIIDIFARKHPRRMRLVDILGNDTC